MLINWDSYGWRLRVDVEDKENVWLCGVKPTAEKPVRIVYDNLGIVIDVDDEDKYPCNASILMII